MQDINLESIYCYAQLLRAHYIYLWGPAQQSNTTDLQHHSMNCTNNQIEIAKQKNVKRNKICAKGESDPQLNLGRVACYHYTIGTT
jgi:hypothetical protein